LRRPIQSLARPEATFATDVAPSARPSIKPTDTMVTPITRTWKTGSRP
jgi:hypothetical protein